MERLRAIHVGTASHGRYWVQGLRGSDSFIEQIAGLYRDYLRAIME